jgi:predicted ATP-binding protein involved in virulence
MSLLRLERLGLHNFRCFDTLDVSFETDITVLFAENGGGKSALLTALAMGLGLLQPRHPKALTLSAERDTRRIHGSGERWEPAGPCSLAFTATIGERPHVQWRATTSPESKGRVVLVRKASRAMEVVRAPGKRWPLLGYYGTDRLSGKPKPKLRKPGGRPDRWEGYDGCLDPSATDGPLLEWLLRETIGGLMRQQRNGPPRPFATSVLEAIRRATPGISKLWFDAFDNSLVIGFDDGHEATWAELSDGYHVFVGLVGDIARRSVILNGQDGADAPLLVEGIVLIDEIDLHLHPNWQRVVLVGLKAAFPKLQFIVTTHSPQVLSSAENRQVRRLVNWRLRDSGVLVEGRDTNSILRELMDTDDRDEAGKKALRELYAAIDDGRLEDARTQLAKLRERWGGLDPELIRAEGFLGEEA